MKKYYLIIFSSIILFFCLGIVSFSENNSNFYLKELASENVSKDDKYLNFSSDIFSTGRDEEGNLYGPKEFIRTKDDFYLLNTFSNNIFIINDGKVISNIFLEDIIPCKISIDNNTVYILDLSQFLVAKVRDKSNIEKYPIIGLDDESVSNFNILGNKAYISVYRDNKDITLIFDFLNDKFILEDEIEGIICGKEVYSFESNNDELNRSGVLTIKNIMDGTIDEIPIITNNILLGVKYLGKDKDGNILICSNELLREDNDKNIIYLKSLNPNNLDIKRFLLDNSMLYSFYEGDIFQINPYLENIHFKSLNIVEDEPQILSDEELYNEYSNKNNQSVLKQENSLASSSISRNSIMENAKKYHTSFSWSCKDSNLSYLKNYKKPRFISKAGTYTCMPYCWGGFNTTDQFTNGLNNGGRVGNINTSTDSHVANTFGLDCSGFVSRCWNLSSHHGTGKLPNVSYSITMDKLQKGDALLNKRHVILFDSKNSNGDFILYEATITNSYDRVSHTIRTISDLKRDGYKAIRFNNVR